MDSKITIMQWLNESPLGVCIFGCDPGPEKTAIVKVNVKRHQDGTIRAQVDRAKYVDNDGFDIERYFPVCPEGRDYYKMFLAIETCGTQFKMVGASVFDTAAMGGAVRHALRPFVDGIYCLRSSEWRHALTGAGNARAPVVYDELKRFFEPTGKGSDPYKGVAAFPGPLWGLHEAGKGGNAEHLKDALGVALGLTMVNFRSGKDPEIYRKGW